MITLFGRIPTELRIEERNDADNISQSKNDTRGLGDR